MSRFVAINLAGMSPPDTIETLETGNNLACAIEAACKGPWVLRSSSLLSAASFGKPEGLATALRKSLSDALGMERLFEVWEQKV